MVVSAESARPAIEPERVQQSDHIDSVRIQNLPINRRDYLGLALLTPGVVNTNHIANAIDRRIAPTPSSGLGIGGGNGRGNTFMIDGLDNLYNSGSVRSSISQNAVHEFQVNRNSFSTEQGGDAALTAALLDRLTHHCSIHEFKWESIRFTESLGAASKRKKKPRAAGGSA